MQTFNYDIVRQIAVFSDNEKQSKEINMVSWNGKMPVYDIRVWGKTPEGKTPYKGITLTKEEWQRLSAMIAEYVKRLESKGV